MVTKVKRQCRYSISYRACAGFWIRVAIEKIAFFFFSCLTATTPNWFWMSMERRKALALAFTIDIQNQFGVHFKAAGNGMFLKMYPGMQEQSGNILLQIKERPDRVKAVWPFFFCWCRRLCLFLKKWISGGMSCGWPVKYKSNVLAVLFSLLSIFCISHDSFAVMPLLFLTAAR